MIINEFESLRREIERRLEQCGVMKPEMAEAMKYAISIVNDAFDPSISELLECCMCGARASFSIDSEDPSVGYCYAEKKFWRIQPGPRTRKKQAA